MILSFRTKINEKPTYFVEKIWEGILQKGITFKAVEMKMAIDALPKDYKIKTNPPKLHTIREDKNNRWKVGTKIDFFINARQKNMFRFAPVLPVVSVQKIDILWHDNLNPIVWIDDVLFYDKEVTHENEKMLDLANYDGFNTIEEFLAYFNKNFTGKIIHWTDKRY